jgi:hypothetical protein
MTADMQVNCSFALTFGVPIALAWWELRRLGRGNWNPPREDDVPPDPAPLTDPGVVPESRKPLPDCLIPQPMRERERELA